MSKTLLKYMLLACIPTLCVLTVSLHASPILTENFDELTPALSLTSAGVFTAIGGTNIDVVGGGLFGGLCGAPESGNCVDMGGSGGKDLGNIELTTPFGSCGRGLRSQLRPDWLAAWPNDIDYREFWTVFTDICADQW